MMSSDTEQWPAPNDAVAFESLCLDLWKNIWGDSNAQKNGRNGHPQAGVDIFGSSGDRWNGVQCKKKDGALRSKLTERELRSEVENAKSFTPTLSSFIVATTAARDPRLQEIARQITETHQSEGRFAVHVWSWEDIWSELYKRAELLERIAETYWGKLYSLRKKTHSAAHNKIREAEDLMQQGGKQKEGFELIREALRLAREAKNEEDEIDALLAAAIVSSDRGGFGDTRHYISEAEKLVSKISNPASKVIFYRAKAKACRIARDDNGAEIAFRAGLQVAETEADDEKRNVADQACLLREAYVHFLCDKKRLENVPSLLDACETYARLNAQSRGGALLNAALEAGIHYYLEIGDESGVRSRIEELKAAATTTFSANHIGGSVINVANHAGHRKHYELALYAARTAIEIAQTADPRNKSGFLVGCLYTEAQMLAQMSRYSEAQIKAQSLLQMCDPGKDLTGDASAAVGKSKQAVASVASQPPEVLAMAKMQLAIALSDNGETESAIDELIQTWALIEHINPPEKTVVDLFAHLADYASQLGKVEVTNFATEKIKNLRAQNPQLEQKADSFINRAENNLRIRERIVDTCITNSSDAVHALDAVEIRDVHDSADTNRAACRVLLDWWDEGFECIGEIYDFWGRGNFSRLLSNARDQTGSFNLTIEVRSLEDVKRAVRLWALYTDFLILIWKGPTEHLGMSMVPLSATYGETDGEIGGHGYIVAAGSEISGKRSDKRFYPAMCFASTNLPDPVIHFLATEAKPLFELGKLVVVPAAAIGCLHPGHGPFEQLIADAAGAIPSLRATGQIQNPISLIPYSPDAPFDVIAELVEKESSALRRLRRTLRERSQQQPAMNGLAQSSAIRLMESEIADALAEIQSRMKLYAGKHDFSRDSEPLGAVHAHYLSAASRDAPDLYSPILTLQTMGYRWKVGAAPNSLEKTRFELTDKQVIGTWLAPPERGWSFAVARRVEG
jgi:tetratricopeptide (TPR) repeat protein